MRLKCYKRKMIERDTLIRIIKDFEEQDLPRLIERDLPKSSDGSASLSDLIKDLPINRAISIIGPRRSGKTYLMFQLIKCLLQAGIPKTRILYVNLESDLFLGGEVTDLRKLLELFYEMYPENNTKKTYLFFDEIQNVPLWERFVRSLLDTGRIQVIISGSSSKLLAKEISTAMRGRTLVYHVYPFSFNEYLKARNIPRSSYLSSSQKARLLHALDQYLWSSYPEAILLESERDRILREIVDVTIYRDIIERYEVKNIKVLRLLLKGMAQSLYFSVHKFHQFLKSMGLKVSKNTLYQYMEYFHDAMIIYPLRKYSPSYKEIEQTIPKIYFIDNGLLRLFGITQRGRLLENLVFVHLLRLGYLPNEQLYYFTSNNKEVDFVIKEDDKVTELIQVTYSMETPETRDRELRSLLTARKKLSCEQMLILTWDQEEIIKIKEHEILVKPLWKWLFTHEKTAKD